jgi:integrase
MPPILFTEAAYQYLENLALENGRNIAGKTQQLNQELIPYFGDMTLSEINRFDVERFKRHLLQTNRSESTINRYLAVLSQLFHKAVEWGWLDKIPCKVVKYREENIRTAYLEPAEINRLIQAAQVDDCPIIEPFIRIALGTAMRRGEILAIKIEHINCTKQEIFIPKAKCGARTQPMTTSLARYLEHYLKFKTEVCQDYLVPAPKSRTGHRVEIEKPFRRVVKAAGLDPTIICRHTLRHTAITHLV